MGTAEAREQAVPAEQTSEILEVLSNKCIQLENTTSIRSIYSRNTASIRSNPVAHL